MAGLNASQRVRGLVEPSLTAAGYELVDVEHRGTILRVTVDAPGGVDLDAITDATGVISGCLDRDPDAVPGRYTLEVSSPGVERPLRTPDHFRRFVGTQVAVKTRPAAEGERRVEGVLESADGTGVTVGGRRLRYEDIERARTVFTWPPARPSRAAS